MLSRREFLKTLAAAPFASCSALAIAIAAPLRSPVFVGMDFGGDDYTAAVLTQWTDGKLIHTPISMEQFYRSSESA